MTDESSKPEILQDSTDNSSIDKIETSLELLWNDKSISLTSKIRLMRSLVTSIFLHACESRTLTAERQRKVQAMGNEVLPQDLLINISYKDHVTNEEVCAKIQQAI